MQKFEHVSISFNLVKFQLRYDAFYSVQGVCVMLRTTKICYDLASTKIQRTVVK